MASEEVSAKTSRPERPPAPIEIPAPRQGVSIPPSILNQPNSQKAHFQHSSSHSNRPPYPSHKPHHYPDSQRPRYQPIHDQYRPLQRENEPVHPSSNRSHHQAYLPRNPTRSNNHVFNIPKRGQARPEHHNPHASRSSAYYGIGMPIAVPTQPKARTIPAAPKPMFSAIDLENGEPRIVNPKVASQSQPTTTGHRSKGEIIDLTVEGKSRPKPREVYNLETEEFNPDLAPVDRSFGAPDPNRFISSEQATQDIKALLAGGFEDDESVPNLRKKVKKPKSKSSFKHPIERDEADTKEPGSEGEVDEEGEVEDGTVDGLAVKLLPHQVEGVAWMVDRENGQPKRNGILPKGGILADDMGLGKTIQTIALLLSNPRSEHGGGKDVHSNEPSKLSKVEIIPGSYTHSTLIVAPLALIKQWEGEIQSRVSAESKMKVLVHHGPSRTTSPKVLEKYDVVITTYQILASEHASSGDTAKGANVGCFGVKWYRVVLDEAHSIKNKSAKCSQAAYALQSWYRWCLTGTPMQNNLDELQSLIRFLRIRPYCEYAHWKEQISIPMKNGKAGLAIRRLQYFLKAVMKRRTKDVLRKEGALSFGKSHKGEGSTSSNTPAFKIQPRTIEIISAKFGPRERRFYDKLADRAQTSLDRMMGGGAKQDYIGALVLLLRLRQACNHPELVSRRLGSDGDSIQSGVSSSASSVKEVKTRGSDSGASSSKDVDDIANLLGGLSVTRHKCDICQLELSSKRTADGHIHCVDCARDLLESLEDENRGGVVNEERMKKKHAKKAKGMGREEDNRLSIKTKPTRSSRLVIHSDDDEDEEGLGEWIRDEDSETDPDDDEDEANSSRLRRFRDGNSNYSGEIEDEGADLSDEENMLQRAQPLVSTKIRHLLAILKKELAQDNKTIVFSEFTSMLDLIEPFLKNRGYRFVRYDGGMRNDHREASLHSLRTDPETKILLCSLKCGGLGLNLTAACRVVLLEPFWNPFAESQAIDRVHRLNQTKPVHVYRLTITDTVEERILRLQEAKQALANAALEAGKNNASAKLSFDDILRLFGRNATDADAAAGGNGSFVTGGRVPGYLADSSRRSPGLEREASRSRPLDRNRRNESSFSGRRRF